MKFIYFLKISSPVLTTRGLYRDVFHFDGKYLVINDYCFVINGDNMEPKESIHHSGTLRGSLQLRVRSSKTVPSGQPLMAGCLPSEQM